ncbi:L,D-transpeptidase family protein [Planctomycetaceae bacterium SH139]
MQTVKTTIVVVLLLTVSYSAYVALTAPPAKMPDELVKIVENDSLDFSLGDDIDIGLPSGGADSMAGNPTDGPGMSFDAPLPPTLDSTPPRSGSPDAGSSSMAGTVQTDMGGASRASLSDQRTLDLPPPSGSNGGAGSNYAVNGVDTLDLNQLVSETEAGNSSQSGNSSQAGGASGYDIPSLSMDDSAASGSSQQSLNDATAKTALANAIATADRQREKDQLREALATLSLFYNSPSLSSADRESLLGRLDWLAGEVIYSTRNLLEQPYRVSQGETLQDIAAKLEVPWQLLATVNGVSDPAAVVPGQELKVIRGPFRAEVNLTSSELTLFLGEMYAGRFPIQTGSDPAPKSGSYMVQDKQTARTYYSLDGGNIPPGDPRNPYGDVWLDLGNQMCIHGSAEQAAAGNGCIQLRRTDARDVFGILSRGSAVTITR